MVGDGLLTATVFEETVALFNCRFTGFLFKVTWSTVLLVSASIKENFVFPFSKSVALVLPEAISSTRISVQLKFALAWPVIAKARLSCENPLMKTTVRNKESKNFSFIAGSFIG